ncbi:hypothetical protein WDW89_03590 [Deltaproteobacteria bacterium TL4]
MQFIAERDFAKKIRFLDRHKLTEEQRGEALQLLLDLISAYVPQARIGENFYNFMTRDTLTIKNEDEIKYNVLHTSVQKIIELGHEPVVLMTEILKRVEEPSPVPPVECFRSLIDLSLLLFDLNSQSSVDSQKAFRTTFSQFLKVSDQHPSMKVALHSFRAYFHTRDPEFIKKGGQLLGKVKEEWQARAHQVFREEMEHQISEVKYDGLENYLDKIKPFIQIHQKWLPN